MDAETGIAPLSDLEIERLRKETPGVEYVRHFNHSGSSLPPQVVLDTVIGHLELEARTGGYEAAARVEGALNDVYGHTAALIGAKPDEIAMVENATRGWDMAVYGIPFRRGDRVVTTMAEYGSNVVALMQLQKRGLELVVVPNDASGQVDLERLADVLDHRVRAVLVTHMPTNGGLVQPVHVIGELVRREAPDAWYVLDACQTAGQLPLDMDALQCDVLSATSRKFLRGPRGVGFVAVRADRIEEIEPPMIDQHAAIWITRDSYELLPTARRLENWEFNVAARLGMGTAIRYALEIGVERIWQRIDLQARQLRGRLRQLEGVTIRDLGAVQGGIVSFTHDSIAPGEIKDYLSERNVNTSITGVASTRYDMEARGLESMMRSSVHVITSDEDIDVFVDTLVELIRSRPRSAS